jgi:hypothetical protein
MECSIIDLIWIIITSLLTRCCLCFFISICIFEITMMSMRKWTFVIFEFEIIYSIITGFCVIVVWYFSTIIIGILLVMFSITALLRSRRVVVELKLVSSWNCCSRFWSLFIKKVKIMLPFDIWIFIKSIIIYWYLY